VVWLWCRCGVGVDVVWLWCGCGVDVVSVWCRCRVVVVWMWCGCGVNFLGEGWHLRATIQNANRLDTVEKLLIKQHDATNMQHGLNCRQ